MAKLKRKIKELVLGSKTYLPKSEEARKAKKSIDLARIRLRKAQSRMKKLKRKKK